MLKWTRPSPNYQSGREATFRKPNLSGLGDCSLRALPTSKLNPNKIKRGKDDGPKHECTADNKTHTRCRTINWHQSVHDVNHSFWNEPIDNRGKQRKWCDVYADGVRERRKSKSQYTQTDSTGQTDRNGPEERIHDQSIQHSIPQMTKKMPSIAPIIGGGFIYAG